MDDRLASHGISVGDDLLASRTLQLLLRNAGLEVGIASQSEAVDVVLQRATQLVILDVAVAASSGTGIVAQLRSNAVDGTIHFTSVRTPCPPLDSLGNGAQLERFRIVAHVAAALGLVPRLGASGPHAIRTGFDSGCETDSPPSWIEQDRLPTFTARDIACLTVLWRDHRDNR